MSGLSLRSVAFLGSLSGGGVPGFESLATVTLSTDAASVSFSSIPNTFQHLQLRFIARGNRAATVSTLRLTLNNDANLNYTSRVVTGDGTSATIAESTAVARFDVAKVAGANAATGIFGAGILDIHDYASTAKTTTMRSIAGIELNGTGEIQMRSGMWFNQSAVSTITIINQTSNILAGSTFALYGIKAAA